MNINCIFANDVTNALTHEVARTSGHIQHAYNPSLDIRAS